MEVEWALFVVAAVGLTALVFYSEWIKPDAQSNSSAPEATTATPRTITCPYCGVENDRAYTYCAACVGELSPDEESS